MIICELFQAVNLCVRYLVMFCSSYFDLFYVLGYVEIFVMSREKVKKTRIYEKSDFFLKLDLN